MSQKHELYAAAEGLAAYDKPITLLAENNARPELDVLVTAINLARLHGSARIIWENSCTLFSDANALPNFLEPIRAVLREQQLTEGELYLHLVSRETPSSRNDPKLMHASIIPRMSLEIICTDHDKGKLRMPPKKDPKAPLIRA